MWASIHAHQPDVTQVPGRTSPLAARLGGRDLRLDSLCKMTVRHVRADLQAPGDAVLRCEGDRRSIEGQVFVEAIALVARSPSPSDRATTSEASAAAVNPIERSPCSVAATQSVTHPAGAHPTLVPTWCP